MVNLAVLLTCHNRKDKTTRCLSGLKESIHYYNSLNDNQLVPEVFLTDDGCTDGTTDAVKQIIPNKILHILHGDGNLYWAGGMRCSWKEAMKSHNRWDYYLLLNDDVDLMENMFDELFSAHKFVMDYYGKEGIISGVTCATDDITKVTYGGAIWKNRMLATYSQLNPTGVPQMCDLTNANILLVPTKVVEAIGIFYEGFQHGKADYDYSNKARKAGFPVVITANFCGKCDNDHINHSDIAKKVTSMTLKQRKEYFQNPIHSSKDYLRLVKRLCPLRVPMVWIGRMLNIYLPKLYYSLDLR